VRRALAACEVFSQARKRAWSIFNLTRIAAWSAIALAPGPPGSANQTRWRWRRGSNPTSARRESSAVEISRSRRSALSVRPNKEVLRSAATSMAATSAVFSGSRPSAARAVASNPAADAAGAAVANTAARAARPAKPRDECAMITPRGPGHQRRVLNAS
jgi:hypothetical protein